MARVCDAPDLGTKSTSATQVDVLAGAKNASTLVVDVFFDPQNASTSRVDAFFHSRKRVNLQG